MLKSKHRRSFIINYLVFPMFMISCLVGCAMTTGARWTPAMSERRNIDTYALNAVQEKTVGESMVVIASLVYINGYTLINEVKPPTKKSLSLLPSYQWEVLPKDSIWEVLGTLENGDLLLKYSDRHLSPSLRGDPSSTWFYCLIADKNASIYADTRCVNIEPTKWDKTEKGMLKHTPIFIKGSFKRELVYNGKSQTTVKLSYREYMDNMIRPAFSQDLSYDLSEGNVIGFKGMKIEVLEATNSLIRFIVREKIKD